MAIRVVDATAIERQDNHIALKVLLSDGWVIDWAKTTGEPISSPFVYVHLTKNQPSNG